MRRTRRQIRRGRSDVGGIPEDCGGTLATPRQDVVVAPLFLGKENQPNPLAGQPSSFTSDVIAKMAMTSLTSISSRFLLPGNLKEDEYEAAISTSRCPGSSGPRAHRDRRKPASRRDPHPRALHANDRGLESRR